MINARYHDTENHWIDQNLTESGAKCQIIPKKWMKRLKSIKNIFRSVAHDGGSSYEQMCIIDNVNGTG